MDSTTVNYGPTLSERLQTPAAPFVEALRSFARSLRVAMPALIVSFDPDRQTVTAQPAVKEWEKIAGVPTIITLPQLVDVPIALPRGGTFTLTMPLKAGDECLIIIADSCIDAWWQSGGQQNPSEIRRHHLADAFCIPGPWSQQRLLSNYSTSSAQLRSDDGTVIVDVASDKITLTAPTVNVTGSSAVHISGSGHTTIEGKDFLTHTHTGVQSGGSVSGPVA